MKLWCWWKVEPSAFRSERDEVLSSAAYFFHESLKSDLGGSPAAAAPSGNVGNDQPCYTSLRVTCTLEIVWFVRCAPVQSADYKYRLHVRWDSVCCKPWIN